MQGLVDPKDVEQFNKTWGTDIPKPKDEKPPMGELWNCPQCGKPNASENEKCWGCKAPRPTSQGRHPVPSPAPAMVVKVVDFNMPFGRMVGFMVKLALAAIPAAIILSIIWFTATVALTAWMAR